MTSSTSSVSSTAVAPSNTSDNTHTNNSESSRAQAEARAAVLASLKSAGSNYDEKFQQRAADIHANAAVLAKQEKEIKKNAAGLAKESARWQKEIDKATRAVNEVGDVQNWAEMLERDLLVLEETLRLAEGAESVPSASGGSSWRVPV